MPVNLNDTKIDPDASKYAAMLDSLQGNILKGHGREHTVHIFIEFNGAAAAIRKALLPLLKTYVTSAMQQHRETKEFKQFQIPGGLFGNFFLTAKGYRKLGFTQAALQSVLGEQFFLDGMPAHAADLNDPDPATWEGGYNTGNIHAMLLLADDDVGYLERQARILITELQQFSNVLAVELGEALRNEENEGIEHFGYVDGRSQPIFFASDLDDEGDIDKWDPAEPLKLALVPDKTTKTKDAFGSYFVFRKLEQDVLRFTVREHALADELGLQGADRERAGAMAVGRFRDGTPLTLSQADGFIPAKENNFTYAEDTAGVKCPFHAHIRKSNPRGDIPRTFPGTTEEAHERPRRIVRRGITYGQRNRHPNAFQALEDLPTEDVGLLFMCFQANIADQFAFMQQSWVNAEGFVKPATGIDPIIGQSPSGTPSSPQNWPVKFNEPAALPATFAGFVKMRGGEFFFAPSIPFLRKLTPPAP